jgi:hypothetical protein
MKVEELVGSLQTFEMNLSEQTEKKSKGIAFKSSADHEEEDYDLDEDFSNDLALIGRQFNKLLRKMDRRPKKNYTNIQTDTNKQGSTSSKAKTDKKPSQGKGVQCHECEGYGHIRTECGTYLKKQKKGLAVSWSDEESDTEVETVAANHVSALTRVCYSDSDSDDEEVTFEQLASTYKELCIKSEEVCRTNEKQKVIIDQLKSEKVQLQAKVTSLEDEVSLLSTNLENMTKSVKMLKKGTNMLDEILMVGKHAGDSSGIGYKNKHQSNASDVKFVPAQKKSEPNKVCSERTPHQKHTHKGKFKAWKCHYCGKNGHIKPFCYKLYGYPKTKSQTQPRRTKQRKMWKPKASEAAHFRSKGSDSDAAHFRSKGSDVEAANLRSKGSEAARTWKPKSSEAAHESEVAHIAHT